MFECFGAFNKYFLADKAEVYLVVVSVNIICSSVLNAVQSSFSSALTSGAEMSTVKRI